CRSRRSRTSRATCTTCRASPRCMPICSARVRRRDARRFYLTSSRAVRYASRMACTRRWRGAAVAAILSGALFTANGFAADRLITGDAIELAKGTLAVRSRDATIDLGGGVGSADDPTVNGGSVRVLSIEGDVFDRTYSLPASGWRVLRRRGTAYGYA